tara:strand:- start:10492 stop:11607 length:1116 start_codon:yes stop_codon:yes gene_type:complete
MTNDLYINTLINYKENLYGNLNHVFSTRYINIYLSLLFILITYNTKHLRGTTYRNNIIPKNSIIYISKLVFLSLLLSSLNTLNLINLNNIIVKFVLLLYLPFYINLIEHNTCIKLNLDHYFIKYFSKLLLLLGDYELINDYDEIVNTNQYLLGIYPHGLFPIGSLGCLSSNICIDTINKKIPIFNSNSIVCGVASFCFYVPIIREIFLFLGAIDCSRPILQKFIDKSKSICVFLGGAQEAIYSGNGKTTIILKSRRGFFELALLNGITIIPVYTFGNSNIFEANNWDIFNILYYFKCITGIWFPRGYFNIKRNKFITVFGKHIKVQKITKDECTREKILELQNKYIEYITQVFDKYKHMDETVSKKTLNIL